MTDKIKELEEQLAQARSEEAKKEGFTVVVFDDTEELKEIKVQAKEISTKEHAEIINKIGQLRDSLGDIERLRKKTDSEQTTTGDLLELLFIIDEPIKVILSRFFNLQEESIATLPNFDLVLSLVEGDDFRKIKDKTDRLSKEAEFINKKQN